jgi:aryl-alcohol dehydrogenase-like predicted oxidoreductase
VDENVAASGIELPPEVLKRIDEVLAPVLPN